VAFDIDQDFILPAVKVDIKHRTYKMPWSRTCQLCKEPLRKHMQKGVKVHKGYCHFVPMTNLEYIKWVGLNNIT
jgi:hypothetical protein